MLTYSGQVCPVFIPTRHTSEASEDVSLHRVHIACASFRGRAGGSLMQLFRDKLSAIYENIINLDSVEAFQRLEDYLMALNEDVDAATYLPEVELDALTELYLFEFSKITKTGGVNIPYATLELPGIQIPHAVISNLNEKPLKIISTPTQGHGRNTISPSTKGTQPDEDSTSPRTRTQKKTTHGMQLTSTA